MQCQIWHRLWFLDFVLSRHVAQVFYEWFWDGSICPYGWFAPIITCWTSVFSFHMRCVSSFEDFIIIILLSVFPAIFSCIPKSCYSSFHWFLRVSKPPFPPTLWDTVTLGPVRAANLCFSFRSRQGKETSCHSASGKVHKPLCLPQ